LMLLLVDEGEANRGLVLVVDVRLTELVDEELLLVDDSVVEEIPCSASEEDDRNRVAKESSHADSPPEPAEIAGMTGETVDTIGDELVIRTGILLDHVGKVGAGLVHADGAESLANSHKAESRQNDEPARLHLGPEGVLDQVFRDGDNPGDNPLDAVVDQETVGTELVCVEKRHVGPLPHVIQRQHAAEQTQVLPATRAKQQMNPEHKHNSKGKRNP